MIESILNISLLCIEKIEDYTKMDKSLYMGSTIIQDGEITEEQYDNHAHSGR